MRALSPRWIWAAAGLALGFVVAALLPRAWLFVTDEHDHQQAAEAPKEVWACPMLCVRLDGPGTCPVCGMDLELLKDTGEEVELNERERRVLKLATTTVTRRPLARTIRTYAEVVYDQRRVERIAAWVNGRVTRLYADTTWTSVRKGDHLFEIYSPELYAAQSEYLTALRSGSGGFGQQLTDSSRQKLLLYGLSEEQLTALEKKGEPSYTLTINAPASGTIVELHIREGDYVKEGTPLYTIADYGVMWALVDAYEQDTPWVRVGQPVELSLASRPGRVFRGSVEFINKAVDRATRTTKVRVVLDNQEGLLEPGMYGDAAIKATLGPDGQAVQPTLEGLWTCYMHPEVRRDEPGDCPVCDMPLEPRIETAKAPADAPRLLAVPKSAVLRTGERSLVYVMTHPPKWEQQGEDWVEVEPAAFAGREVLVGPRAGEWVPILDGLTEGERVVTRGNFLIDSQMELLGKVSLLHPEGGTTASDPHAGH